MCVIELSPTHSQPWKGFEYPLPFFRFWDRGPDHSRMARWRNRRSHEARAAPGEKGKWAFSYTNQEVKLQLPLTLSHSNDTLFTQTFHILFDIYSPADCLSAIPVVVNATTTDHLFTGMGGKLWAPAYERQLPAGQSHRPEPLSALWMSLLPAVLFQAHWSVQKGMSHHIQDMKRYELFTYSHFLSLFCFILIIGDCVMAKIVCRADD